MAYSTPQLERPQFYKDNTHFSHTPAHWQMESRSFVDITCMLRRLHHNSCMKTPHMHTVCQAKPSVQSIAAHNTASIDLPSNLRANTEHAGPSGTYSRCAPACGHAPAHLRLVDHTHMAERNAQPHALGRQHAVATSVPGTCRYIKSSQHNMAIIRQVAQRGLAVCTSEA